MSKITQKKKNLKLKEKGLTPLYNSFCKEKLPILSLEFGQELSLWVLNRLEIELNQNDYEYPDNFRFYELGNIKQEQVFKFTSEKGCCGSYEKSFKHPSGRVFVIGFNYGH